MKYYDEPYSPADVSLVDDGTLDTVLSVGGHEFRYDSEFAAEYRDEDTGELNFDEFVAAVWDEIADELGDVGQDRESYSDDQDREGYSA